MAKVKRPVGPTAAVNTQFRQPRTKVKSTKILPEQLVGAQSTVMAEVDGIACGCLLGTGSQVTCLSEDFYRKYLKHRILEPLDNLVVIGASGSQAPYLGYTEIDLPVHFSAQEAGVDTYTTALVLITPTQNSNHTTPLLIGTNTGVIKWMPEKCKKKMGSDFPHSVGLKTALVTAF